MKRIIRNQIKLIVMIRNKVKRKRRVNRLKIKLVIVINSN